MELDQQELPQIAETILYNTLSPLTLAADADDDEFPDSDDLDQYSVLRNEISLFTPQCDASYSTAPDFFSLDVTDEASGGEAIPEPVTTPVQPKTPALVSEPTLESGWFRGNCKFRSPMLQLHKEIVDFCEFLSPTPEEKAKRDLAIKSVFDVIKLIWPHCQVEIFGSFRTGLYLPTSDIDVVILKAGLPNPQMGLNAISKALSQRSMAKKIQVIGKARVPIIKFVEKKSGLSFDISFDIDNGPKAAEYIQDAVARWPQLRPLCLILKVFLQQRELNEVYSGGIGSYALLTMLMALLRNIRQGQASAEHNLGLLLVHFFDFYGRKLNTSDVGISCNGAGTFFLKKSKGFLNNARPFLLGIEDPQAPENDIGKNSFNYFQVRSAFSMAFTTLTNPKIILSLGPNRSILGTIIRPDPVLMERKGGSNGEMTFNSLLPGAGEPLQQQYGEKDMLCNWQFDYDEEPLPRGNDTGGKDTSAEPKSGRKNRKFAKEKRSSKKIKENGDSQMVADVHDASAEPSTRSSRKKRKSASKENSSEKGKENGGLQMIGNVENGNTKENGTSKKKKKRHRAQASC